MKDKKECITCERVLKANASNFYKSYSPWHKDGLVPTCKKCLNDRTKEDDTNSVRDTLRILDRPFLSESWKKAKASPKSTLGTYLSDINLNFSELTYDNSDGMYGNYSVDEEDVEEPEEIQEVSISNEVKTRWLGYTSENDIIFLEAFYQDLIATYEHKTPIQRNIYKNMAETQLLANKAREANKISDYKNLLATMSTLMTDAKVKPLQDTGEEDGGLSTWGQWIKKIEETEPIPQASEEFKDVDGITKYINKWFVRHFAKVLGLANANDNDDLLLEKEKDAGDK